MATTSFVEEKVARVASAIDEGSVTTSCVPSTPIQASSAAASAGSASRVRSTTTHPIEILLLAFDGNGRSALSRILEGANYAVHVALDTTEAKRKLSNHRQAGVAVIDLRGNGFDGTEAYASLCQSLPPDRELAAIFLARSPSVNDVVRALRLGARDLLRSPVQPEHLLDAIHRTTALLAQQEEVRRGARAVNDLLEDATAHAAVLLKASMVFPKARSAAEAAGHVEFTELLDHKANQEDTSSLVYTKRHSRQVAAAIRMQALRRAVLGAPLLDDFATWDMLLDLYKHQLAGRSLTVSNLCNASSIAATTALRRLDDMAAAKLVARVRDSSDKRRVFVRLTEEASERIRRYFDVAGASLD